MKGSVRVAPLTPSLVHAKLKRSSWQTGAGREAKATDASALRLIFSYEEEAGMQTVESGQVLIDKRRGWTALLLTLFVVLRADHYAQPMVSAC